MKETENSELIGIYDVGKIFNRSIDAMRKYKTLGLIEPCKRVVRKDLYKKEDIVINKHFIESYQKEGKSLQEIAKLLNSSKDQGDCEQEHRNN